MNHQYDIAVIGAGPSGSVASTLLKRKGYHVCVLEKQYFPRFVIGESLLPHCMEILSEAGMINAIETADKGFQFKNGASFTWGEQYTEIDFRDKFTAGPGTTYQVRRADFDHLLIQEAQKQGVEVYFGQHVNQVQFHQDDAELSVTDETTLENHQIKAKFVLDASGYGRVLPRLLDLDIPSHLPIRTAYFTHIDDNIAPNNPLFDRNKILICTHPEFRDVWLWFIPFADNRTSIGVVGTPERLAHGGTDPEACLKYFANEIPRLKTLLANAVWDNGVPYRSLKGYSSNVKQLYGDRFALLGNATEFLDPVFSSGVTIALHSAKLATDTLDKQLKGQDVDWQKDFVEPLMLGVNTFRTYVDGWYDCSFQDVIYAKNINPDIRRMIASILAGYAWDSSNPFVQKSKRRLEALAEVCRQNQTH